MSVTEKKKLEFSLRWLTSGNIEASGKHIGVSPEISKALSKDTFVKKEYARLESLVDDIKLDAISITRLDACLMYAEAYSTAKKGNTPAVMIQATSKLVELYGINPLTQSQIDRNNAQNVSDDKREDTYAELMKQLAENLPD